jgi:hypothetical protein
MIYLYNIADKVPVYMMLRQDKTNQNEKVFISKMDFCDESFLCEVMMMVCLHQYYIENAVHAFKLIRARKIESARKQYFIPAG